MHCPFCRHGDTRVIDSRVSDDGTSVRRRRECEACGARFNTIETAEIKLPNVLKRDGRREAFDAAKLRRGLEQAFHKRPIGPGTIEPLVERLLARARVWDERELESRRIGEWVMAELKAIDQVAYVRFASVYRRFEDVRDFREEFERLERELPPAEGRQLPLLDGEPVVEGSRRARRSAG
jgi:transcriptional repressor NrdR